MGRLNGLDDFTQSENAVFQKICRKLLKMTFIVKEKNEEHRKDFNFIRKYNQVFSEYFQIIGYDVICDSEAGVARMINLASAGEEGLIQSNKKRLKLWESVVLCALWLKYEDFLINGSLTRAVIIPKAELDFQLEKFGAKNKIDKSSMTSILKLFESFNLIEVLGQVGEPDCRIRLFTSLQFCISETEFRKLVENTANKMQGLRKHKALNDDFDYESGGEVEDSE